jgi:hypothetical protein
MEGPAVAEVELRNAAAKRAGAVRWRSLIVTLE